MPRNQIAPFIEIAPRVAIEISSGAARLPQLYHQTIDLLVRALITRFAQSRRLEPLQRWRPTINIDHHLPQLDYATLHPRLLGDVYESLLQFKLMRKRGRLLLTPDRSRRKSTGTYYTPDHIVRYICDRTLQAIVRQRDHPPKVLDPAMGCGHFLTAAFDLLSKRLSPAEIIQHCLFGIDIDPIAVEIAKATLWLCCADPKLSLESLDKNLRCANAMLDSPFPHRFDAVIGNPPYGPVPVTMRKRLRYSADTKPHTHNLAAAFIHESFIHFCPSHNVGMIVPKSLTYSRGWSATLNEILPHLDLLIDANEAFDDVLLEQVIFHTGSRVTPTYAGGYATRRSIHRGPRIDKPLLQSQHAMICRASREELALLRTLLADSIPLGSIVTVDRGSPLQPLLVPHNGRLTVPVLGGRAISRFRIDTTKLHHIPRRRLNEQQLSADRAPKIVAQNIIAHITRPQPHVRIIAAYDTDSLLTLDTVNRIRLLDAGTPWQAVLAVLNSKFASWFAYRFIYNRAVRTMHFDRDYVGRIPFPKLTAAALEEVRTMFKNSSSPSIDEWVYRQFDLSPSQRRLIESTTF